MNNEITILEQKVIDFFDVILRNIDKHARDIKITEYTVRIEDNETSSIELNVAVSNKISITKDVIVYIALDNGTNTSYVFKVPIPVNNLFVVNGNVRINLNYLDNNDVVKVIWDGIRIDRNVTIFTSQPKNPEISEGIWFNQLDDESNKWVRTKVESVDLTERDPRIAIKLKVLFELDELPTTLNQELFEILQSKHDLRLRDNIINKEFITTSGMLIRHLREGTYEMLRKLRPQFYKGGTFASGIIQAYIHKFFNLRSLTSVGIQTPNNINPITYNSLRNKIILSKGEDKDVAVSMMDASYTDFVDMLITPDNKNVDRINELTTAINITDDGAKVKCYDSNFNEIEVPFIEYLSSDILVYDYVDYDTMELNAMYKEATEITVKRSGLRKVKQGTSFDYIELHPDMRLSKSTQQIPMINHMDSVRGSMGARMIAQSIEVIGCEKPIVSTGHDNIDSDLMVKAESAGRVVGISKGIVTVETTDTDEDGKPVQVNITRPPNLQSMYGINISFQNRVKLGQTIFKDDVIFSPNSIGEDKSFNAGVNCLTAMMNFRGFTYEDGVVLSESAARKFAHTSIDDIEFIVSPTTRITGIRTPSTDLITSVDSLCDYEIKLDRLSKSLHKTRSEFLKDQFFYTKKNLNMPLNTKAYLVDVKYIVGDLPSEEDESIYQVEQIISGVKLAENLPIAYEYAPLSLNDFGTEKDKEYSYKIKFRLVVISSLEPGDKITNRYGSKGVDAIIVPDNEMPRLEDGSIVEAILNPAAVVSRKNLSQTMELYLTKFSKHIKNKLSEMLNTSIPLEDVRTILTKYKFNNYAKLDDDMLIRAIKSDYPLQFITGNYSKVDVKTILDWFESEELESGERLIDGKTGRPIRKPVIVGQMYLIKLYHLAGKKAQVTVDHTIKAKFVLGKGKESTAGLKHGTMEMDALSANNLVAYTRYIDGNDKIKSSWFLGHFILAGLKLERPEDIPPVRIPKLPV